VTTPESLFLLLGSKARENLRSVHTIIVDEIHALAPTKRGAHLALSLERLEQLTPCTPQRIGLSATVRPLDEVANFLGGRHSVSVVDASGAPNINVQVIVPIPDMENPSAQGGQGQRTLDADDKSPPERGLWPAIYPTILDVVLSNRTTIIFVNSRGLCERLAQTINELWDTRREQSGSPDSSSLRPSIPSATHEASGVPDAGPDAPTVLAHHGIVSHEQRAKMEHDLKRGALRGIVATSSLELGIDMGTADTVIQIESPGSVARGLQRSDRSGHQVGAHSIGRIIPKFKSDLLECAVIGQRIEKGLLEAVTVPTSPLDVLAQQVIAICCDAPRTVSGLLRVARGVYGFRNLTADALSSVLEMLSGHYPSDDFANLTPRLSWDRATDIVQTRRGTQRLSRLNASAIPDRGLYGVFLGEDGPELAYSTKKWCSKHARATALFLAPRPGRSRVSGGTVWSCPPRPANRVGCHFGTAIAWEDLSNWAVPWALLRVKSANVRTTAGLPTSKQTHRSMTMRLKISRPTYATN
jgi:ATP-dependent Lhr-like helicase